MANAEGIIPARHEVERQLERLLADAVIGSHPQPAKLLAFIVGRSLDGGEVTEKLIREFVFPNPPYKEDSNIARVTMDKVRKLLAEYYADEGADDPVIIALPQSPEGRRIKFQAGQAYTPEFRYNPRSARAREFTIAHHLLSGGPAQIEQAMQRLGEMNQQEPNHPDVVLGITEAFGSQLLLGIYDTDLREPFVAAGLALIEGLGKDGNSYWRAHNVAGLLHCAAGRMDEAGKAFDIALTLNRQGTVSRGWYIHYLFAIGRQQEAVRLIGLETEDRADNAPLHALHGIYLCHAQQYEEAERAFAEAFVLDRNCWFAHFGMAQLCTATGRPRQAEEYAKRLEALLEPTEYAFVKRKLNLEPPAL
jgi:tetratricopeptide (TPR) repeat protein